VATNERCKNRYVSFDNWLCLMNRAFKHLFSVRHLLRLNHNLTYLHLQNSEVAEIWIMPGIAAKIPLMRARLTDRKERLNFLHPTPIGTMIIHQQGLEVSS
jgi:hypothetical protein